MTSFCFFTPKGYDPMWILVAARAGTLPLWSDWSITGFRAVRRCCAVVPQLTLYSCISGLVSFPRKTWGAGESEESFPPGYSWWPSLPLTLTVRNIISTVVFVVEMVLKLLALRWMHFMDQVNLFDFVIVIIRYNSIQSCIISDYLTFNLAFFLHNIQQHLQKKKKRHFCVKFEHPQRWL